MYHERGERGVCGMLVAILTGAMSLANFYMWSKGRVTGGMQYVSVSLQLFLLILTIAAAISYGGRRRKKLYPMAPYKIFTLPFGIILVSLLGNLCVLAAVLFYTFGVV